LVIATARLGYAWDRALFYVKTGGAWTRDSYDLACNSDVFAINGCLAAQDLTAKATRTGWVVGAGLEFGLTRSWSAKAEYNYLDFGSKNLTLSDNGSGLFGPVLLPLHVRETINEVKIGVNYRFGVADVAMVAAAPAALVYKAAPAAPWVPVWSGAYVGVSAGARLDHARWDTTQIYASDPILAGPPDITTTPAYFFGATFRPGAYAGFNWQVMPRWLVGVEGDIAWGSSERTMGGVPGTFGNGSSSFVGTEAQAVDSSRVKFGADGSLRARVGVTPVSALLIYATGGVTFQDVKASASCDGSIDSFCFFGPHAESFSTLRTGWTIGGGAEAVLWRNWLGRIEYRFADYGDFGHTFFAGTGDDVVANFKVRTHTLLTGLAYKFDWAAPTPVVAKY
jgi:outer membrane immunogenic protein